MCSNIKLHENNHKSELKMISFHVREHYNFNIQGGTKVCYNFENSFKTNKWQ